MMYMLGPVSPKDAGQAYSQRSGYVHLTADVTGLSAILATLATAFIVAKWIGAAYLVYLLLSAL